MIEGYEIMNEWLCSWMLHKNELLKVISVTMFVNNYIENFKPMGS